MARFAPGTPIVVRGHRLGSIRTAKAVIAVEDDDRARSYWWPAGTEHVVTEAMTVERAGMFPHTTHELRTGEWSLTTLPWTDTDVLASTAPDSWAVVWHMWDHESGEFLWWYVDLKRPHRRTPLGFDTYDLDLDLVVRPDGSWEWKDEDEFANRRAAGLITDAEAAAVERAGAEMVERIERRQPPFDGGRVGWRPDPLWPAPTLVPGWQDHPVA